MPYCEMTLINLISSFSLNQFHNIKNKAKCTISYIFSFRKEWSIGLF